MTNNGSAEIVRAQPAQYEGLQLVVSPAEAKRRVQELQAFVEEAMVKNVDFGVIPGTDKPTLFQQGAQKLAEIYGFSHRFEWTEVVKDWDRLFFYFEVKCVLTSRRNGQDVGEGIGSCNSKESKYAYRWSGERDVPVADRAKLKSREREGKYGKYIQYQVPNDDIASQVNTLQKMAAKRAYVHAVISVTRSSGLFSQDNEDLPEEAFGEVDDKRSWERGPSEAFASRQKLLLAATSQAELDAAMAGVAEDIKAARLSTEEALQLRDISGVRKKELAKQTAPPAPQTAPPPQGVNGPAAPSPPQPPPPPARDWAKEGQELWNAITVATSVESLRVLGVRIDELEAAGAPSTKSIRNHLDERMAAVQPAAAQPTVNWSTEERVMENFIRKAYTDGSAEDRKEVDKMVGSFMNRCPAATAQRMARFHREAKAGRCPPEEPFG